MTQQARAGYFRRDISGRQDLIPQFQMQLPIYIDGEVYYINPNEMRAALLIVDAVKGFCKPGCGALAPRFDDPVVNAVLKRIEKMARAFQRVGMPIITAIDCHEGEEWPWPLHCQRGSEECELVDNLTFLYDFSTIIEKPCLNTWLGAEAESIRETMLGCSPPLNGLQVLLNACKIQVVVVVGFCTDLCVEDVARTLMSAMNSHILLPHLKEVVVPVHEVTTYDLPIEIVQTIPTAPDHAAHPRDLEHYLGLHSMQKCGIRLVEGVGF